MSLTSATSARIRCPHCQTEYAAERLGVKVGPKERSLLWCKVCGLRLRVHIEEVERVTVGVRSWRTFWRKPADTVTRVTRVDVGEG